MVVTAGCGVHGTRMVDWLVSQLLGGLHERNSWMIHTGVPKDQLGVVVGKSVMNTPCPSIHRRLTRREAFHWGTGEVWHRLLYFIIVVVQALAFKVLAFVGSCGRYSTKYRVRKISFIYVGIRSKYCRYKIWGPATIYENYQVKLMCATTCSFNGVN